MKTLKTVGLVILVLIVAVLGIRFLSGPEDDWICRNGEWIKHGQPYAPQPTTACGSQTPDDKSDLIVVDSPKPNEIVASPLVVKGKARGTWFFEASFPVELVVDGQVVRQTTARAQGDWMTTEFVPFIATIDFSGIRWAVPVRATIVLKNDNPSGLPQNDKRIEMPVLINPSQTITVKAFFSNNNLDPAVSCNKVFPVSRQIEKTEAVARAVLEELLKGPTAEEKAQGYFTNLNPSVKIQKLTITNGIAKVDFDETMEQGLGGSCRVSAIRAQIIETLKQFFTVKDVIISVNGRTEDILQP